MALDPKTLPVENKALHVPSLEEVAQVFRSYLPSNFAEVDVEVVDTPDLTKKPFLLAGSGLGGNPKLIEFGGTPYLLPLFQREKVYDLRDIAKLARADPSLLIGAGAGPHPYIGVNCEGIINILIANETVDQQTRISKVNGPDEHMVVQVLPNNETRVALLGNLYSSEAKPGKAIKVHVKKRTGQKNFIETLRNSIENHYNKDQLVGIGGVFLLAEGKAKQHVMRDFSKTRIDDDDALNKWLKFYEMAAPLIAVGTFTSNDGGNLDLRVQHFHSFSTHGEAGHYHYDTTPDTVEYLGYFNVAQELVIKSMAGKFLYFAYGSNLLSHRIHINNPSAERVGIGYLKEYQINFVTYSKRWRGCSATIEPNKSGLVWGALWHIDNADMENLDRQEGVHHNMYRVLQVDIHLPNGKKVNARTYQQTVNPPDVKDIKDLPIDYRPSVAYWKTIIKGAEESGLPQDYLDFLHRIPHNEYDGPVDVKLPLWW